MESLVLKGSQPPMALMLKTAPISFRIAINALVALEGSLSVPTVTALEAKVVPGERATTMEPEVFMGTPTLAKEHLEALEEHVMMIVAQQGAASRGSRVLQAAQG